MTRRLLLLAGLLAIGACADAVAQSIRTLDIALVRFRSWQQPTMLRSARDLISTSLDPAALRDDGALALVRSLDKHGGIDLICRQELPFPILPGKLTVATNQQTRMRLIGRSGDAPAITRFDLKLDLSLGARAGGLAPVTLNGLFEWSPDLLDRWSLNSAALTGPFLRNAADASQALASFDGASLDAYAATGASVVKVFKPENYQPETGSIFELPTLKRAAFTGSRALAPGDFLCASTITELGGRPAQAIILIILARP